MQQQGQPIPLHAGNVEVSVSIGGVRIRMIDGASGSVLGEFHLSHTIGKVTTIMLKRVLKEFEVNAGDIGIPMEMWERLKVAPEDW